MAHMFILYLITYTIYTCTVIFRPRTSWLEVNSMVLPSLQELLEISNHFSSTSGLNKGALNSWTLPNSVASFKRFNVEIWFLKKNSLKKSMIFANLSLLVMVFFCPNNRPWRQLKRLCSRRCVTHFAWSRGFCLCKKGLNDIYFRGVRCVKRTYLVMFWVFFSGCSSFDLPNIANDWSLSRFKSFKIVTKPSWNVKY